MIFLLIKLLLFTPFAQAQWARDTEIVSPRENVYQLPEETLAKQVERGKKIALFYPVTISELLIPYHPLKTFFEYDPQSPVRKLLYQLIKVVSPFKSMDEVFKWLGVHDFPNENQPETPNSLPQLSTLEKSLPMGATLIQTQDGEGLTFGCAACHASDLFGVKVLGLSNRFPRANELFSQGKSIAPYVNSFLFRDLLKTTEGERLMLVKIKQTTKWVGTKAPQVLGLDTSLAQVALSLARRKMDPYATRTVDSYRHPRTNKLETMVADSKPAVWWNIKYKNRWLSDGSIVSGNPVHTNFLWNEIGRGTDLKNLETWMNQNTEQIQALTAAVFATKPPRFEKFFGVDSIDIEKAKRGQKYFQISCQKCHGTYQKGWDDPGVVAKNEQIQTTKVTYHKRTPVLNVGTDPGRYLGMKEFSEDLNRLQISKTIGTVVEPQKGYVPPPLDGIWARWPYFHNNSVPSLCALLTKASERPKTYIAGPAKNKYFDYDQKCAGYPTGTKVPEAWKNEKDFFYDTKKEGLSNLGHDEGIFLSNGKEIYSLEQKLEIIEFLKTL